MISPDIKSQAMQFPADAVASDGKTNLSDALERTVIAGKKILYDKKTHSAVTDAINKPGPLGQKVAEGIVGLVMLLQKEAKDMPHEILIPAALTLTLDAFDYLEQTGLAETSDQDLAIAMQIEIEMLLKQAGANMDEYNKLTGDNETAELAPGNETAEPMQPDAMMSAGAPQPGLLRRQ